MAHVATTLVATATLGHRVVVLAVAVVLVVAQAAPVAATVPVAVAAQAALAGRAAHAKQRATCWCTPKTLFFKDFWALALI